MVNYWSTFRKTRSTPFPKFSLLDQYRKAVGADLSYRTRWFDTALLFPPDAVQISASKKLPDRYTLENKLMSLWIDKYPNLLRVPITSDVGTNLFLGLHPLHWLVAEQKKLITGPAKKTLTDSFSEVEKKLKELMSRRNLARRIQATQAVELGARRGQVRWQEPIEWVSWVVTEAMPEIRANNEPFILRRQASSPIYLSERWAKLMQVIKMNVLEADENGKTRKITATDLPPTVTPEDVSTFVEYYPQYATFFDEQLTISGASKDLLLQNPSLRAKVVDLLKQWSREKITKDKFYTEIAKLEREVEVAKQTASREQKIKNSPDPFESGYLDAGANVNRLEGLFKDLRK